MTTDSHGLKRGNCSPNSEIGAGFGIISKKEDDSQVEGLTCKRWEGCSNSHKQIMLNNYLGGVSAQTKKRRRGSLGSGARRGLKSGRIWTGVEWEWQPGSVATVQSCFSFPFPEKKGRFL